MIRVVVADDQDAVRAGLVLILDGAADVAVVGQAADGEEAVVLCQRLRPDVALLDVRMPRLDGISATREIVAQDLADVLVLTTFDLDEYVFGALRAGAAGFLLKDTDADGLITAVRTVARGDGIIAPGVTRRLIGAFAAAAPATPAAPGPGPVQPGDRRTARHGRVHHQDPREPHPGEAGAPQPGPSRDPRPGPLPPHPAIAPAHRRTACPRAACPRGGRPAGPRGGRAAGPQGRRAPRWARSPRRSGLSPPISVHLGP
jgi:DNA-binding NarL/FixJ family response regulator